MQIASFSGKPLNCEQAKPFAACADGASSRSELLLEPCREGPDLGAENAPSGLRAAEALPAHRSQDALAW